jgi:predicted kinase
LLAASGAVRIRSDVERKRLFDLAPEQRSQPEQERLLYCEETTQNTLDSLEQAATDILGAGFPVIVDATCLRHSTRSRFRDLAARWEVPFVILYCTAPLEVLRERLAQREKEGRDASEAGVAVMQDQLSALEPLSEDELALSLEVDSSTTSEDLWRRFQALLVV